MSHETVKMSLVLSLGAITIVVMRVLKIAYLTFDRMTDNETQIVAVVLVMYVSICGLVAYRLYESRYSHIYNPHIE